MIMMPRAVASCGASGAIFGLYSVCILGKVKWSATFVHEVLTFEDIVGKHDEQELHSGTGHRFVNYHEVSSSGSFETVSVGNTLPVRRRGEPVRQPPLAFGIDGEDAIAVTAACEACLSICCSWLLGLLRTSHASQAVSDLRRSSPNSGFQWGPEIRRHINLKRCIRMNL